MIWPRPRFNFPSFNFLVRFFSSVFLISIEIDLLTSNQKRKNGQYDRGVCVLWTVVGFFLSKNDFFEEVVRASVSLLSNDCVSSLPSLSCLFVYRFVFFLLSLIVCVPKLFATLSIFKPKSRPFNSLCRNFRRTLLWRSVALLTSCWSGVSPGYPPVFHIWTECEIKGTKPKEVDWIDGLHFSFCHIFKFPTCL